MRSVMAPRSPWLVKTQTWNSTVLSQDVFYKVHRDFQHYLSSLFVISMHKLTHLANRTNTHIQTSRHMHKSSSCLCYKKNPPNIVFFVNNTAVNLKRDQFFLRRMQPHRDLDLAHTHTTECFHAIRAKMPSNSIWEIVVWLNWKVCLDWKGGKFLCCAITYKVNGKTRQVCKINAICVFPQLENIQLSWKIWMFHKVLVTQLLFTDRQLLSTRQLKKSREKSWTFWSNKHPEGRAVHWWEEMLEFICFNF